MRDGSERSDPLWLASDERAVAVPVSSPVTSRPPPPRRVPRAVSAVALVALLLLSGFAGITPIATPSTSTASPSNVTSAPATPAVMSAQTTSTTSAADAALAAADGRASLCLLGVAPGCLPRTGLSTSTPLPSGVDPPSSWTQITPPNGAPNPPGRFLSSMTYYPAGHEVLLFGGYGELASGPWVFFQDTWAYASGHWTEIVDNASCTPTTCPAPRAGAMMTYYPPAQGVLLYGGYVYSPSIVPLPFSDTWLFTGGSWHNITATADTPPSPRFDGSMTWDSRDGHAVLFGGAQASGLTLGDTWTFAGTWENVTSTFLYSPYARAGAAISNSPAGYILLFGGEHNGTLIEDLPNVNCGPRDQVAWWYYQDNWTVMSESYICIQIATTAAPSPPSALAITGTAPPCGREDASLGWSPQNQRFVLFGGIGPLNETGCTGFDGYLNDTWTYGNPLGGPYYWQNATDPGDPPARFQMGAASDFTDNYFEIFGGYGGYGGGLNDTWRFFELVHAKLSGPATIDTGANFTFNIPFTVVGYGGTNNLDYSFTLQRLKTPNTLVGTGCTNLTGGLSYPMPYDGVDQVSCEPTQQSYNYFRLTLLVVDNNNTADRAWSNWTFIVEPPFTAAVYSQYQKYFYSNFDFNNVFTALLEVAGEPATSVSATIGGNPLTFNQRSSGSFWWDTASMDMANVAPGSKISVFASFNDWTENATYQVQMIDTPAWLYSIFQFTQASQTVATSGKGPYNKSFAIYENYSWDLSKAFGFTIPVPLVSGDYSLIPTVSLSLSAASKGTISLTGGFSLATPKIDLGVASLTLTAKISLQGTFALITENSAITGINWVSAKAVISLTGDFGASVPIYGFNILGVQIGFTLKIDVAPSVALNLILMPTTDTTKELINGIQMMVSQIYGSFALPLSVAVSFGIGFASVSLGGKLELDLNVGLSPQPGVSAGWVNGSVFVSASALFWSDSWTLIGPATIYSWVDPPQQLRTQAATSPPGTAYDNGTGTTWKLNSRYYTGTGYDAKVWDGTSSQGVAISDIYPHTQIAGAAASNGAVVFYSDDNAQLSLEQGLTLSGIRLDSSSNGLTALPAPADSGFVLDRPVATTLPDGSLYVVWAALPSAEASLSSPLDLTSLELHGAHFYPANGSWGPVRRWTTSGIVESYALDGRSSSGRIVALVAPTFLLGSTTSEQLLTFDIGSGAQAATASVSGISEVLSARGGIGAATVQRLDGNDSILNLTTGATVPQPLTIPAGEEILSEAFVLGSASTLLVLVRTPTAAEAVLVDLTTSQSLATLPLTGDAFEAHALLGGSTYYVFVADATGIQGWTESGGAFANLTTYNETNVESFNVVQTGSSLALFSLVTNGNATQPIVNLTIDEIGASLPAVPGGSSPSTSSAPVDTSLYVAVLGVVAAVDALLVAILVLRMRRRGRPPVHADEGTKPEDPPTQPPASPPGG